MIKQSELAAVVQSQQEQQQEKGVGLERDLLHHLPTDLPNHALIISGIRRCGKSTLLSQWMKKIDFEGFFLNFDTPKLYNFELTDFELLDEIIVQSKKKSLFFDEIQVIDGWELYVRQKLDQGYKVTITGSNASLLSKELGTKLTGRHINKELFPFSFSEFLRYHEAIPDAESLLRYMTIGGFPEYIKTENPDILAVLIDDILYRDIAVRYNIRDVKSLKRLLLFLASNNGNLVTATKLTQTLGIKSPATILDYFSFFEQSYLLQLMPKFSYSYRVQLVNPRKVYFVDTGLINVVDVSFSHDLGRKLENVIFWELRRQNKEIYYYNENGYECDFVVCNNKIPEQLIQVCYELNKDNSTREERGLLDAMNFFKLDKGTIITFNQQDTILHHEKRIEVVPAHRYLSQ
jgi:predicted AAA+ superfamily ATPase